MLLVGDLDARACDEFGVARSRLGTRRASRGTVSLGRAAAHQAWPQRAHCSFAWATPQASQTGIGSYVRGAARPGAGPATEEAQVAARARAENGGRCKKWNSDGVVCCVWGCPAEILLQSAQILLQSEGLGFR